MLRKDVKKVSPSGTADSAEIARFNALAEEWWKPDGAFKVIHAFNRVRVTHLLERLPLLLQRNPKTVRSLAGMRIIDVGCGAGLVTEPLSRLGAEVLGIDAAERNVLIAQRHAHSAGASVQYRHALPEEIVGQHGVFQAVISLEVVEHVADLQIFLETIGRLVAPGGILVIGTLNRTVGAYVKAIIGAEYILRWLPRGTHDWQKFVNPRELDVKLRRHGFETVERCGVTFNPVSRQWTTSKDVSVNYMQFHRKR